MSTGEKATAGDATQNIVEAFDAAEPAPPEYGIEARQIIGGAVLLFCRGDVESVASSGAWIQARPSGAVDLEEVR